MAYIHSPQHGGTNSSVVELVESAAGTSMTLGVLSNDSLAHLDPALVSPGLLALVGEDAPTRAILCAGAGHFARANVTLSQGRLVGAGADAGEQVIGRWEEISDRTGEIVPAYGFTQVERELTSAGVVVSGLN